MSYYFGYDPSSNLQAKVIELRQKSQNPGSNQLYVLRDEIALQIADEFIDEALGKLLVGMPSDRHEFFSKVVKFIKNTVQVLLKQILGKASDSDVLKGLTYFNQLVNTADNGAMRVGAPLPEQLHNQLKAQLEQAIQGEDSESLRAGLSQSLQTLNDAVVHFMMVDFAASLNLGFIKRKAVDLAASATTSAVNGAIAKLIPSTGSEELRQISLHFISLLYSGKSSAV